MTSTPEQLQYVICSNCGMEQWVGYKTCQRCGTNIQMGASALPKPSDKLGVLVAACSGSIASIVCLVAILKLDYSFILYGVFGGVGAIFGVLGGFIVKIVANSFSKSIGIKTWAICGFISSFASPYLTWLIIGWMITRSPGLIPG